MLGNAYDRLRNFRTRANSSSSSMSADRDEPSENHAPFQMMPSSGARISVDSSESDEDDVMPPPYDEVVSDDAFVASELAPVSHRESYRTRRSRIRSGARVLSMEYGLRSSKIYMRG